MREAIRLNSQQMLTVQPNLHTGREKPNTGSLCPEPCYFLILIMQMKDAG